ncbi:MAG: LysR family transcriptional regulator [Eggerthellaceae bacterium]|nr:LysR family transcriptional regulator [Eggerthellaceae bacterium]
MELEQLRQLVEVERQGTISAAAEKLHLTQPSLSRSIKRLEADLGQGLFDRTRNRIELNEAGRIAVEHARDVLAAEQRMRDAFDDLARRARTVKVGSIAPAPTWNLTARIVERFPGTILEPDILDEKVIERSLFDRTIDLAITRKPIALPNCECIPLMTESLSLYAPKSSKYAGRRSVSWNDIDGETFLVFEQIGFWREVCEEALPNATAIFQKDREVFIQLLHSSDLLGFTTDAPQNRGSVEGRIPIPIQDASAHATFYLVALKDAPERVSEIVTWIRETT